MITRHLVKRAWAPPMLAVLLASCTALPSVQSPTTVAKTLLQEPLGETSEPNFSLYILTLPSGAAIPTHSHARTLFAYVLSGDIENQIDPDAPIVFHPAGVFHERVMQVHRIFKNLSKTEPAKILIFQNTGSLPSSVKPLIQKSLANLTDQQVSVLTFVAPPGAEIARPHEHSGSVFTYVLRGAVESQIDPEPPTVYHTGEVLYEAPMHAHRLLRNASKTEPVELVSFEVTGKALPLATGIEKRRVQ
jgi:quercetin dioxygenase-like cupin family protein